MGVLAACRWRSMSATGRRLMTSRALIYRPLIEEETLSHYQASDYFPVHINQVLFDRYKVAVKLGFGGSSTVWLCEDLKFVPRTSLCGLRPESNVDYKTLKILTRKTTEHPEVKVLKHLQDQKRSNGSWCGVRKPRGDFEIAVADGRHHCIVYEALGMNLLEHLAVQPDGTLGGAKTRWVLKHLLEAVDYLHSSGVVHTGKVPTYIEHSNFALTISQIFNLTTSLAQFHTSKSSETWSQRRERHRARRKSLTTPGQSTPVDRWSLDSTR